MYAFFLFSLFRRVMRFFAVHVYSFMVMTMMMTTMENNIIIMIIIVIVITMTPHVGVNN